MCNMNELEITPIGDINKGIDGLDKFCLVRARADDITMSSIQIAFEQHCARLSSSHPGALFCSAVSIVRQQYQQDVYIVTVHYRYDC